mmetsp:Transcript_6066/g.22917  ORF Transcript_6066/g.22917 Transcript_6066/m.22917 type:complete len:237 (+) Transcript_6066:1375-2085(+)
MKNRPHSGTSATIMSHSSGVCKWPKSMTWSPHSTSFRYKTACLLVVLASGRTEEPSARSSSSKGAGAGAGRGRGAGGGPGGGAGRNAGCCFGGGRFGGIDSSSAAARAGAGAEGLPTLLRLLLLLLPPPPLLLPLLPPEDPGPRKAASNSANSSTSLTLPLAAAVAASASCLFRSSSASFLDRSLAFPYTCGRASSSSTESSFSPAAGSLSKTRSKKDSSENLESPQALSSSRFAS